MAWRNVKVEDLREYLVKTYHSKLASMKDLCLECGISRKTGYKWYQRFLEKGSKGLVDQSKAPKQPSRKFSEAKLKMALELKQKYPRYGPKKILALLKKRFPGKDWPCATRLYQVFKEHHLVSSRKLKRRVPRTKPLGDVNHSNDVWCADFKGWFLTQDQCKVEPLTITDGFSKFVIRCLHLERKRAIDVWSVFFDAFHDFGLPKRVRTDNGPPFGSVSIGRLSTFSIKLIKAGVTPEWIDPGHPEQNGSHERYHRSLKEAVAMPAAATFPEQIKRMEVFQEEYNFERPHESLNQETPGSCYEASPRHWDGVLRAPEYDTNEMLVRKVGSNGCIHYKRKENYLGQTLAGEYVGLKAFDEECFQVFYGPIFLGNLIQGQGFKRPEMKSRRQRT